MTRKTLAQYIEEFLTPDNASQYAKTMDKFIFVQDLTDLPIDSKILEDLDLAFWNYCEAEKHESDRFDYTNKYDR